MIAKDSTYVVMGILNTDSIAYATGRLIEALGGKVIWTAQNERMKKIFFDRGCKDLSDDVIQIKQKHPQLEICSSLGMLTEEKAIRLKEAGVNRFNHNLETSEKFFPEVVSTHDFDDRVNTAKLVKKVGLDLCCGGLFGMGESMQDRVDLAFALSDLQVDSVPVNFLDPRPGTAFHGKPNPLTPNDCLRALAMMRFVMPSVDS